jgi:hypothetical protein
MIFFSTTRQMKDTKVGIFRRIRDEKSLVRIAEGAEGYFSFSKTSNLSLDLPIQWLLGYICGDKAART